MSDREFYKFKGIESKDSLSWILELISGRMYLSRLEELNDPHEAKLKGKSYSQELPRIRIGSLSGYANYNYMLWIHYANSLNGVALHYKESEIQSKIEKRKSEQVEIELVKVNYVVDLPEKVASVRDLLSNKLFQWFYEFEWRIIANLPEGKPNEKYYLDVKPDKVLPGEYLSPASRTAIEQACKLNGVEFGNNIHPNFTKWNQSGDFEAYVNALNEIGKVDK